MLIIYIVVNHINNTRINTNKILALRQLKYIFTFYVVCICKLSIWVFAQRTILKGTTFTCLSIKSSQLSNSLVPLQQKYIKFVGCLHIQYCGHSLRIHERNDIRLKTNFFLLSLSSSIFIPYARISNS